VTEQTPRDALWREYYRAMQAGDKAAAQRIVAQLHSPPQTGRIAARPGGCSRCRRSL
jgi:hypothetical protein